jgi:hypothetical protein
MWRRPDFTGPPLQQANALFDALRAVFDFSFYAFWDVFGRGFFIKSLFKVLKKAVFKDVIKTTFYKNR